MLEEINNKDNSKHQLNRMCKTEKNQSQKNFVEMMQSKIAIRMIKNKKGKSKNRTENESSHYS